ncbi:MAG TPA: nuclear transport factor 2 family protein [Kofleriaceae bacterium]|jgi:ketosteroid isomerase-like protein
MRDVLHDQATATAEKHDVAQPQERPDAIAARVQRLGPEDHVGLAALLPQFPQAKAQIVEAAQARMGNSVVQRALSTTTAVAVRTATDFYSAFARRDAATMAQAYAPNVKFHDPLFGNLHGSQVMLMWNSIMPAAKPFDIKPTVAPGATSLGEDRYEVHVNWDAHYGLSGRQIHNNSQTTLVIQGGKIVEQRDVWNLDAWTAQALPLHLGGHRASDLLVAAAAHGFIAVLDLIRGHHGG